MVVISFITMLTLFQNCRVIGQNGRTLQTAVASLELQKIATSNAIHQLEIEEQTRLNPELECGYKYGPFSTNYGFVLRNVGSAQATNIYLRVSAACVTSNSVYALETTRVPIGSGVAPLVDKIVLAPGEQAAVQDLYFPNLDWLEAVRSKYDGDVLVRLYVEYERPQPIFRRYAGYFNFVFAQTPLGLKTAENSPRLQSILERYNSIPRTQRFSIWSPIHFTNHWEIMTSNHGGVDMDNETMAMKSLIWSKHN